MRKILPVFFFISIIFANCVMPSEKRNEKIIDSTSFQQNDTFHLLCKYWKLTDADHPTEKDVSFTNDNGVELQSGIVFITDSTVLENPTGEMTYGKFSLKGNVIHVNFDDGRKAVYTIQRLHKNELLLKRTENKHTSELTYEGTQAAWPDAKKNPFSKENYKWTIKPKKPETDAEIKERVKESVQFYLYYFNGFINGNADQIDFKGLPNCLNWYQGGITIQNEENLNKKWISCFYSKDQALEGRQILQDAILKKYNWNEKETNWLKQTTSVLQQIHDRM
ncbi:MAG: hypothetical protein ACTHOB_00425 [Ginsengibacter sp.]